MEALLTKENFFDWFWKLSDVKIRNGDRIIERLNLSSPLTEDKHRLKLRLEKFSPCIYGVLVNYPMVQLCFPDGKVFKTKLMKIGMTQCDTASTSSGKNRMEQVRDEVIDDLKDQDDYKVIEDRIDCSIVFVLAVCPSDLRMYTEVERDIRQKTGLVLPKYVAKDMKLPIPTEWVLTTQSFIDILNRKKDELKSRSPFNPKSKRAGSSVASASSTLTSKLTVVDDTEVDVTAEKIKNVAFEGPASANTTAECKTPVPAQSNDAAAPCGSKSKQKETDYEDPILLNTETVFKDLCFAKENEVQTENYNKSLTDKKLKFEFCRNEKKPAEQFIFRLTFTDKADQLDPPKKTSSVKKATLK